MRNPIAPAAISVIIKVHINIGRPFVRHLFLAAAAALVAIAPVGTAKAANVAPAIAKAIADPARSEANRARDVYRNPAETLAFFEVRPGQTVIEFYPGGGWYTEILAPALKGNGRYVAMPATRGVANTQAMLDRNKEWFGSTELTAFDATAPSTFPAGTADRVLTFRNIHNLIMAGDAVAAKAFADFHAALKPGGILGVVDHRLPEDKDSALEKKSGYIKRSTIVRLATAAGFKLAGETQVNANPKDTHDWPEGVWTLPPTYRLGETDRAKYQAIGESDRLTLKFVKP